MMGERVKIHGAGGGLHLLVEVLDKTPQEDLIQKAAAHQVKVYPTRQYWLQPEKATDSLIQLGFSGLKEEEIVAGIELLCEAWF
jgi:GntR family transcriptional regulator/MocR family aminotransferase